MKTSYMWVDPSLLNNHPVTGLSLPLREALGLMKSLGFDGIELMIGDPFHFDSYGFSHAVRDHGLEISQICTGELYGSCGLSLNHPDSAIRSAALSAAEAVVKLAGRAQCPVGIGRFRGKIWDRDTDGSMGRMAESLRHLDLVAAAEGVTILLEPLRHAVCDTLNTVAETAYLTRKWGLGNFGWLLDTDHVDLCQFDAVRIEVGSLGFVHLSDSGHRPLGRGTVPFGEYLELLAEIAYEGYCSVEVFPDAIMNDESLLADMATRLSEYFLEMKGKTEHD